MYRKKPDVDVIMDILDAAVEAYPSSEFLNSLWRQYQERGGLSKKQLEGLHKKVSRIQTIPASKLATLQAEILKRPNRYKSEKPPITPLYTKDQRTGKLITEILTRYPQHKRVVYFQSKYNNNEPLSLTEITELEKFYKHLIESKQQG
jgi:hypothetical protein